MTRLRMRTGWVLSLLATAVLASSLVWVAVHASAADATMPLAAWVPQGPLLTIEAKDFSALLKDWVHSPQEQAWVASDNYSAFSRSRLFSRLGEAQDQFAASAGLAPDANFLQQVAGRESVFAWYDIGNLQFLFITHMPHGAAEQTPLLQLRGRYQQRQAGADVFYIRTQGEPERTVAFAVHGDYLLLATREDLLASALLLMQQQATQALQNEAWYTGALAAAAREPGELRMTLNLARIVQTPYFRSYWVQRNVSEMKQYSAAVSDLYRTPESFREERVLVPAALDRPAPVADLTPILTYLPASAGVYRASAQPGADAVVEAIGKRIYPRAASDYRDPGAAPAVDLAVSDVGDAGDLERRIDAASLPRESPGSAIAALREVIEAAQPDAMLTASWTSDGKTSGAAGGVFLSVHSVVVLSAASPWDAEKMEAALADAMRARLTAANLGLDWQQRQQGEYRWIELSGLQPLALAVNGKVCVLATDADALVQALSAAKKGRLEPQVASVVAGFRTAAEREHFARMTSLLDHNSDNAGAAGTDGPPPFFSRNLVSLGRVFQALDSETFSEKADAGAHVVRETVLYRWRP